MPQLLGKEIGPIGYGLMWVFIVSAATSYVYYFCLRKVFGNILPKSLSHSVFVFEGKTDRG